MLDSNRGFCCFVFYVSFSGIDVQLNFFCVQVLVKPVSALPDVGDFFWEKAPTPLLDTIDTPSHLKKLSHKVLGDTLFLSIRFEAKGRCNLKEVDD